IGRIERDVDVELVAPLGEVPRPDLAGLGRDQLGVRTRLVQRLARLGELDLLDALRGQDRDSLALDVSRHEVLASRLQMTRRESPGASSMRRVARAGRAPRRGARRATHKAERLQRSEIGSSVWMRKRVTYWTSSSSRVMAQMCSPRA